MKAWYRKELGLLSLHRDSAPIEKRDFLICVQKARLQAFSESTIKAGWKATGLWPVSLAKPLFSRLLAENSNKAPGGPEKASDWHSKTPTFNWDLETSAVKWFTPKASRDLHGQLVVLQKLDGGERTTRRLLFDKIGKGFAEKDTLLAASEIKIKGLEARLDALRPKKRRKVEVSPNSRFAEIRGIQRAQIAAGREEIEEYYFNSSSKSLSENLYIFVQ